MDTPPWIPITGDDAGPRWPSWLNPAHIVEASFWSNDRGRRIVTVTLTDGRTFDLSERRAIDAVGYVTRGGEQVEVEPAKVGCGRR